MAKTSLAQFCASYKIDSKNLEKAHTQMDHAISVLHIFSCWVENFFPYPVNLDDVKHIHNIVSLLAQLITEADEQLELAESQLASVSS